VTATLKAPSARRILVVKLRAIGDVVLSTVVLKNLRLAYPEAHIAFLTEPPAVPVVSGNPDVDEVLAFDRGTEGGAALIRRVRAGRFDKVLDLFGNPRTALLTFLSGAPVRVGYRFRGRAYAYNVLVEPRGDRVHNTRFNLDALDAAGVPVRDLRLAFPLREADRRYAEEFLRGAGLEGERLLGVNTGGGWYTKRWPAERFAALADRIGGAEGGTAVLLWGPGQKEEAEQVRAAMTRPSVLAPPTTLNQLGALLARLSLLVTNDSGPMHIAAAVGTPVLGIYGPTRPELQGPYGEGHVVVRKEGLGCLGCNLTACPVPGHPCMRSLGVEEVFSAYQLLRTKNPSLR
jgi:lipopolysaccharide heptosyltransferase II